MVGSCFLFQKDAPFAIQSHLPLHSRFTKREERLAGAERKVEYGWLPVLHAYPLTGQTGCNDSIADMEMTVTTPPRSGVQ